MAESDIKLWLKSALSSKKLDGFSVKLLGNSAKGDGYMGDVLFVRVDGIKSGTQKEFDLVLKCSKKSEIMRNKVPVKEAFLNEICFYDTIAPFFENFEKEKRLKESFFRSVPKYFGKFVSEDMEVLALENLKKSGYELYDKKKPLTRNHIELVVKEYAKFHAISGALQDQRKEEFEEIASNIYDTIFEDFTKKTDFAKLLSNGYTETCDLLKGHVDSDILKKYKNLENFTEILFQDMWKDRKFSVIIHGDCWNNNFMYYYDAVTPTKVAILDWQVSAVTSPIRDLSYFLFTCISGKDVKDLEKILGLYYDTFSDYLTKLGSDPEKLFPRAVFFEEWTKFAKFGLNMSAMVVKIVATNDDIKDIQDVLDSGGDISDAFTGHVEDKAEFISRMKNIVEYASENNLLSL